MREELDAAGIGIVVAADDERNWLPLASQVGEQMFRGGVRRARERVLDAVPRPQLAFEDPARLSVGRGDDEHRCRRLGHLSECAGTSRRRGVRGCLLFRHGRFAKLGRTL